MNIFIIIILKKTASRDLLLPRRVESTPLSGSSTQHMCELLAGTPWQVSHGIRGVGVSEVTPDQCASKYNKSNLKQGVHILSYITGVVAVMDSCFALIWAHQHGIAVGPKNWRILVSETLYCRGSSHCVVWSWCFVKGVLYIRLGSDGSLKHGFSRS